MAPAILGLIITVATSNALNIIFLGLKTGSCGFSLEWNNPDVCIDSFEKDFFDLVVFKGLQHVSQLN